MTATLKKTGGWLLILIGLAGCVLPIIPGVPILIAGIALVGVEHPFIRPGRDWLRKKGILK